MSERELLTSMSSFSVFEGKREEMRTLSGEVLLMRLSGTKSGSTMRVFAGSSWLSSSMDSILSAGMFGAVR